MATSLDEAGLWNADGRGEPITLKPEGLQGAYFSPDSQRIATASYDGIARVWNANRSGEPVPLDAHSRGVPAGFDWRGTLLSGLQGHARHSSAASFSPDCQRVVTASQD